MVASHAFADSGTTDTEHLLRQLAGARGPLRRVAAALAAGLVERHGWGRLGFARLGDYARERLGVSARSLQEWARVGAQLDKLPELEAALVSGRLPWSKVRLLARLVDPEEQSDWIAYASDVPVRQLERELRAVDRGAVESGALELVVEDSRDEPHGRVRLRVPAPLAFKWHRAKKYTAKVEGGSLSAGDVLERVTAEVASTLPVALEGRPDGPWTIDGNTGATVRNGSPRAQTPAGGGSASRLDEHAELPAFLLPLLDDLADASPFELDARLRRTVRLEQRLDAELAPLLRVVTSTEYEWKERYATLATLARESLGMSPSKLRALIRVERIGDVCPELRDAFRDGRVSWVQAQVLARLLDDDTEGEWRTSWVRFAQTVTVRRLAETIERACLWRDTNPTGLAEHANDPERFAASEPEGPRGGRQTCARPRDWLGGVRLEISAPNDVVKLFHAMLCTVRRAVERETGQLPPESVGFEAMLDHALECWQVDDRWLRRQIGKNHYAVLDRDDWRCVFPGCSSRRNLHVHHIVFRSAGGSDDPSNLTTLCAFHHQRGVHDGTVTVRGLAPDRLEFEFGLRPGHEPLARFRSGDRKTPPT